MQERSRIRSMVNVLSGVLAISMAAATPGLRAQNSPTGAAPNAPPPDAPKPPFKRLSGPITLNPGEYPAHFPYPDEDDSAVAAAEVHHVRYIDAHVRLVEVAYLPGMHGQMHGHPFPSVFAVDAPTPKAYNLMLDPDRAPKVGREVLPKDLEYPYCRTMNPQSPHAETNQDTWPHHFYRLEFFRVDGSGIANHWQEWYPKFSHPPFVAQLNQHAANETPFSSAWPYPLSFDSVSAAPQNNHLLYEDDHIRMVEVMVRPGETELMQGTPYPFVIADDTSGTPALVDTPLDSKHMLDSDHVGSAPPPPGFDAPRCMASAPQPPHTIHNTGAVPLHYYRIEFKRIDGEDLRTHWREWYPWMGTLTDELAKHPYVSNYY